MNSQKLQNYISATAFNMLPPLLQASLLEDNTFVSQWDIPTIANISIGDGGPSFDRSKFLDSIRTAMRQPERRVPLSDTSNVSWYVMASIVDVKLTFFVEGKGKKYLLEDHSGLSDNYSVRTAWLERTLREVRLRDSLIQKWRNRMEVSPLGDDEFAELEFDIDITPVRFYRNLKNRFRMGSVNVTSLVPTNRKYFEQLIGKIPSSLNVTDYFEKEADILIEELQEWDSAQGLLFSFFLCSSGTISENIDIKCMDKGVLMDCYNTLTNSADPISEIGAIEVALANLDSHPELGVTVQKMTENILAQESGEGEGEGTRYPLLSALIIMVDSEISRRRILERAPPFYRRQAAIAHASLIVRAISDLENECVPFTKWVESVRSNYIFFLQSLVDLRLEPRWLPDFVSSSQLRAEFVGRLRNSVNKNKVKIESESLQRLLIGGDSKLAQSVEWPLWALPGPLEGSIVPTRPVPDSVLEDVALALEAEHLDSNTFTMLINSSLLLNVPSSSAELAAIALRRVKHSIDKVVDDDHIFGLVWGIAVVAAVTRSTPLANELRILTRIMRRRGRLSAEPIGELRIAMVSAAAHEDLEEWAKFAGEWITEIAFEVKSRNFAQQFLPSVRRLVLIEPALARHCTAADAALASFQPVAKG